MTPAQMERRASNALAALINEIDQSFLCPRTDYAEDRVILGLMSKAISLARSICHLVRGRYYAEAFGLSRSSLEIFLLAKYISNKKSDERALSYRDFFKAHFYNREEVRRKYFPRSKRPTGIQKQWIDEASKFPGGTKQWQSAWNMASELLEDRREISKETGKPYQALFEFDAIYEHTSHFVHCTSLCTAAHVPSGENAFKVFDGRKDDRDRGYAALSFAVGYLQMTTILALRQFHHSLSPRMDKLLEQLLLDIKARMNPARIRSLKKKSIAHRGAKSSKKRISRYYRKSTKTALKRTT